MIAASKLTIRLPSSELNFVRHYAKTHGMTLTDLVLRYFGSLSRTMQDDVPPEVARVAGIVPRKAHASHEYHDYLEGKHS